MGRVAVEWLCRKDTKIARDGWGKDVRKGRFWGFESRAFSAKVNVYGNVHIPLKQQFRHEYQLKTRPKNGGL